MKKYTRIVIAQLLVISMVIALTACGDSGTTGGSEKQLLDQILAEGKLSVVMNIGNEPWTYKDSSTGKYAGMAVDLIQGYCDELGVECAIEPMEFTSLINAVNSGKAEMICTNLSRTVERSTSVMFTDAIGSDYGVVICKKGAYKSLDEVNQNSVTLTTETGSVWESVAEDVFPDSNFNTVDTTPNAVAALQAGRADCMVTDLAVAEQLVKEDDSLEIMNEYCYTDTMSFAVNNTYLNTTFLASFNSYMRNIKSNGTYNEIYKKYFDVDWEPVNIEQGV